MNLLVEVPDSFDDLLRKLWALSKEPYQFLCRGQSRAEWSLRTTLDRALTTTADYNERLKQEASTIDDFRRRTEFLLDDLTTVYLMQTPVAALTVLQHFGVPTRLLDWTQSIAVAAFFTCVSNMDADGAVWWLERTTFEEAASQQWDLHHLRRPDRTFDFHDFVFRPDPLPVIAPLRLGIPFPRAGAQQGLFTIAGSLGVDHDQLLSPLVPNGTFGKLVISSKWKREVLKHLASLGITAASIQYAGADCVGHQIATQMTARRK